MITISDYGIADMYECDGLTDTCEVDKNGNTHYHSYITPNYDYGEIDETFF